MRDDGRGSNQTPHEDRQSFNSVPPELEDRLAQHDERLYRAHEAAAEVTGLPAGERPEYVSTHPGCLTPEFVELMIAMARECRLTDADNSVRYAHLAATAAEAAFAAGSDEVDDARALAFAELGNGHRICGDLRRAGIAFGLARERAQFVADPLVNAEIMSLEASYLDYRRDFTGAEQLLLQAEQLQEKFGSPAAIGRLRLKRGAAARRMGDSSRAIGLLQSALELVDTAREPRLRIVGVHNLATALLESEQSDAALSLIRRYRAEYERVGSPADQARLGWLEARAAIGAGLLGLATVSMEEVCEQFVGLGMPYEASLVNLDLAELYSRQGRWDEAKEAASVTLKLAQAYDVSQEALAASQVLIQATEQKKASAEALAILAAKVRRALRPS